MRRIARLIVMDRPEPPMADAALAPHGSESGPMLAPQTAVGIAGVVFRGGHFHAHPSRYIFLARHFVSNVDTLTRRALDCFIDALGRTWTGTPQALAIELQGHKNSPASQPGRGLIHSDAADNRAVPLLLGASLWTTTQKPQGGFPFLTAFDSIIIPLLQGAFEGQFPKLAIYKRMAPIIASALKQ